MIERETVLILGAGASIPYQFPSGRDLTRNVVAALEPAASSELTILEELGFARSDTDAFCTALRYSGKSSVDAFLEHRTEFIPVGKAAMAAALVPLEKVAKLFMRDNSWYDYLYSRMNCPLDAFGSNRLSVVTFNYDRSLECYLHTALTNSYGLDEESAASALEAIPIVHVHGQLGVLPWQAGEGPRRPYEPDATPEAVKIAADSIRVIHEAEDNDPVLIEARRLIDGAEAVVFLGFGYHEQNVRRLQLNLEREYEYLGGSIVGLTNLERDRINQRLFNSKLNFGHEGWGVLEFLRQRVEL